MVKKLSSQKNIKIIYKSIDSDINFKNKEKEIRKNIDMFISKIENSVK